MTVFLTVEFSSINISQVKQNPKEEEILQGRSVISAPDAPEVAMH